MAAAGGEAMAVQDALQAVAEGTGWTYAALWRLCTHQGALVWAEGHYNGAIKTRKTTVAAPGGGRGVEEAEAEEGSAAAHRRSRQLRLLYDSLAAGAEADGGGGGGGGGSGREDGGTVVARPPIAALAPEDLSETEWFYLMCASYCFPPGLRQSACIPINDDDVLEIGTTEKVEEDIGLIEYARRIFMDQHGIPMMPTLSGHSASHPSTHINHQPSQIKMGKYIGSRSAQPKNLNPEKEHTEMEDDDDIMDSETNTENDSCRHLPLDNVGNGQAGPNVN